MTPIKKLEGVLCLVPTVFDENGRLDVEGFSNNIVQMESEGMHGIVAMASMGQYFMLDDEEFRRLAEAARAACRDMACLIGTLHQSTREAVARSVFAEGIEADAVYVSPPYFSNWLDSESCYAHYKAIHDATRRIQIMAYNFDAFGFTIDIELWERLLRDCPRITAVKECTPIVELGELTRRHGERLSVMVGLETSLYPNMLLGGRGTVGVFAAGYPKFILDLYKCCAEQRWDEAFERHQLLNEYIYEWQRGKYSWDNKGICTAAGLAGGFQREPLKNPSDREIAFHRQWLARLDQSFGRA
ncbi:MAG: dihydrodipicolinate synthase family protein [Burkholderiales bacterium]|nr:dihydrodipicolinate synthase family protein [Burkholderiales bacterium]